METTERTLMAGLVVQEERLHRINGAATLDELERVDGAYAAWAVIAADPMFADVFLTNWTAVQ